MTVEEYAKKIGYDNAEYRREWRGYTVYEPVLKDKAFENAIGYPYKIMEQNGGFRMQTLEECLAYMDECAALDAKEYFGEEYEDEDE